MEQFYETKPYHAAILDDVASFWGWEVEDVAETNPDTLDDLMRQDPVPGIAYDLLIGAIKAYRREID